MENSSLPGPRGLETVPAYAPAGHPSEITTQVTLDKAVLLLLVVSEKSRNSIEKSVSQAGFLKILDSEKLVKV